MIQLLMEVSERVFCSFNFFLDESATVSKFKELSLDVDILQCNVM